MHETGPLRKENLKIGSMLSTLSRQGWARFLVAWFASYAILVSFFLSHVGKNFNYHEIFPHELIFPLVLHAVTALIVVLAIFWIPWLRGFAAKLVSIAALSLFLVEYDRGLQLATGFVPGISQDRMALMSLVFFLMLYGLSLLIGLSIQKLTQMVTLFQSRDVGIGVLLIVACLLVVPLFSFLRIFPAMVRESRAQAPEFGGSQESDSEKPDIYYIVLDRYTNNDILKHQFSYDNSNFTKFLTDNNFYINDKGYANYPHTAMSVASTFNGQYTKALVDPFKEEQVQARTLYHNMIWQSAAVKALKAQGYEYHAVGSWYAASYKAPLADYDHMFPYQLTVFNQRKRLRGVEAGEFIKGPYFRFSQITGLDGWPLKLEGSSHEQAVLEQLEILQQLSTSNKSGGRLIFAHILVPHPPYVFNADGSYAEYPSDDNVGKQVKEKYTGQVAFINSRMKELITSIQKQSAGQAIILLNADEGPYPQFMNDTSEGPQDPANAIEKLKKDKDMRQWPDDWLKMKFGILQAAHIPKASENDLASLSSINLFRIILNRYAGYSLDYLPNCQFGLTEGIYAEYKYADITPRFSAKADHACEALASVPTVE